MSEIIELDLDELDAKLYTAWQALQKGNYGMAESRIASAWREVRLFRIQGDDAHLLSTRDRNPWALLVKLWYWLCNLQRQPCQPKYNCEWVYPYGFVPEADCPIHDREYENVGIG